MREDLRSRIEREGLGQYAGPQARAAASVAEDLASLFDLAKHSPPPVTPARDGARARAGRPPAPYATPNLHWNRPPGSLLSPAAAGPGPSAGKRPRTGLPSAPTPTPLPATARPFAPRTPVTGALAPGAGGAPPWAGGGSPAPPRRPWTPLSQRYAASLRPQPEVVRRAAALGIGGPSGWGPPAPPARPWAGISGAGDAPPPPGPTLAPVPDPAPDPAPAPDPRVAWVLDENRALRRRLEELESAQASMQATLEAVSQRDSYARALMRADPQSDYGPGRGPGAAGGEAGAGGAGGGDGGGDGARGAREAAERQQRELEEMYERARGLGVASRGSLSRAEARALELRRELEAARLARSEGLRRQLTGEAPGGAPGGEDAYVGAHVAGATAPLTAEEEAAVRAALRVRGAEAAALNPAAANDGRILGEQFSTLAPGQWLNDEVMRCYLHLLQARDAGWREAGRGTPRVHIFNSQFFSKLMDVPGLGAYARGRSEYNYAGVKRWTKKLNLRKWGQASDNVLDCDLLVVPINLPSHWVCAAVDLRHERVCFFDSMGSKRTDIVGHLKRWVQDEFRDKRGREVDASGWEELLPGGSVPQQENGFDCGVFTLMFADFLARGVSPTEEEPGRGAFPAALCQENMPLFRQTIARDLLRGRAE